MIEVIDRIVNWTLALILVTSVLVLFGEDVYKAIRDIFVSRKRINFYREKKMNELERLLSVVSGNNLKSSNFIIFSVSLAIVLFIVFYSISGGIDMWVFFVSIGGGLLPAVFQWRRLQNRRIKSSYEGLDLITTFYNSYIVCNSNMLDTLNMTAAALKNCPYSRENVARLSKAVQVYRAEAELQEAVDVFAYSYKTEWAKILAFNIFTCIFEGLDISAALNSLIEQFKRAQAVLEKSKRNNMEAGMLLTLLAPITYFGLLYYSSTTFGRTLFECIALQFTTPTGLKYFFAMVVMIIVCWSLSSIISRPKYDL